jgi:branched-chain amino acid transport system substrate-binding protein
VGLNHVRRALVAVAVLITTIACTNSQAEAAPLRIGMLVPLGGPYQSIGADLRNGFQLYLAMHGGRLGGRRIDLRVVDEGDGAQTALPVATKLVKDDKVVALTGFADGGSVAAVAPLLAEAKLPLVGSNERPQLKDVKWVWHTSFGSDEPGSAIARYVKDTVDGPVSVIGPDRQSGHDELRGFTDAFTKAGGVVADTVYTQDFGPALGRIQPSGAKAVYAYYAGQAAVDFVKSYARSTAADLPLYAAGFLTEGAALAAQGDAARNVFTVLNYSPDLDNEANRTFVAAWLAAHPETPATTYAMASYDAAAVLDRAIAAAGSDATSERINSAIGNLGQLDSPRGVWQFGQRNHTPVQRWYLRQVRADGRALANVVVQDLATLGG